MEQEYLDKFAIIYKNLNGIYDDVCILKDKFESKSSKIQARIDMYESKLSLTVRQDEILDELQDEFDEIEEDIETIEDFLEHIDDAIDLITFDLDTANDRLEKWKKRAGLEDFDYE